MRPRGRELSISIGLIPYCCAFLCCAGTVREELARLLWGQHPMAVARIHGIFLLDENAVVIPGVSGHVLEFQARLEIHPQESLVAAAGTIDRGGDVAGEMGQTVGGCKCAKAL